MCQSVVSQNQVYVRAYVDASLVSLGFILSMAGVLFGICLALYVSWHMVGVAIFFSIPLLINLIFVGKAAFWINFADKITARTLFGLYTYGFDEIEGWDIVGHDSNNRAIHIIFSTGPAWFYASVTDDQVDELYQYLPRNKESRRRSPLPIEQRKNGLFGRLRESVVGKPLIDPVFGELEFDQTRFIGGSGYYKYWLGRARFDAIDREIGIILVADETGPTEEQRTFYLEISSRWESVIQWLPEAIYPAYCKWFADSPRLVSNPQEMFQLLEVTGITIEQLSAFRDAERFQDFQIDFFVPGETEHQLVAHIKNWDLIRASFE